MIRNTSVRLLSLAVVLFTLLLAPQPMLAVTLEWTRQLGTSATDHGKGISADGLGNVYISGFTGGSLGGPIAGTDDAFVSKYSATGVLQWTRQLGTARNDESNCISADGLGNVYISGRTNGGMVGGPASGTTDAFVSKYDAAGTLLWTRQFGADGNDNSYGVSADGLGNVYITGLTDGNLNGANQGGFDAFIRKYNSDGAILWTRQIGSSGTDYSHSVSADGLGNVYISGYTSGSLGGLNAGSSDAFVSKYDAAGTLLWTQQLGTTNMDISSGVSVDGLGNVYISGYTGGSLGGTTAGFIDAFVSKYDAAGTLLWTRQFGTSSWDGSTGITADGQGNVYISGYTKGSLGAPNAGNEDAFMSKLDAAGTLLWTKQFGTAQSDYSFGISADGLGSIYITGDTQGSLGGPNSGSGDVFIVKYSDPIVPEPASLVLLLINATLASTRYRRYTP